MQITFYSSNAEVMSELGHRIKTARIGLSVTQEEMARLTNRSIKTISNLETGKDVSFSTVIEVLRALGRLQSLDVMIPAELPRPSELAVLGKPRERASRRSRSKPDNDTAWKWGDEK